jgi:natural product biosynthesis luciferase-like monooxygenase protein
MSSLSGRPQIEKQETFWTEQIAKGPEPFELPTDHPRLPAQSFLRESVSLLLPSDLREGIEVLAEACGTDPFAVVMGALAFVAVRGTGREDVWLGTVAHLNRENDAAASNLLAVRLQVSGNASVRAFLADVHDAVFTAARNRDVPFSRVLELAGVPSLFRVLVVPVGVRAVAWEAAVAPEPRTLGPHAAACDLVFTVAAAGNTLELGAEYDTDLFRRETIQQLLDKVHVALSTMVADPQSALRDRADDKLDFSLLYFGSDEGDFAAAVGAEKYRLLLQGARFADQNGFSAVWTPERHFHTFGGLFPSPAVAAGALAMITERIDIRAGSVVLPLHNPIRVTEEWALVDNLSNGRAGIAFASGWQPQDFAIAPEAFPDRQKRMFEGIEMVRGLWRGETRQLPGGDGQPLTFGTRPRPVQAELPVWLTAGGSPETFRRAGEIGANVLTHLLQQSVEQLGERIAIYRKAWRESGHPGEGGKVSLMVHTFVSDDETYVRSTVHGPFRSYLKGSVGLFAAVAPKGLDLSTASASDLDALAEHAFERYFESGGLFGTPTSCAPLVKRLKLLGVTELACLIDFGIAPDTVLAGLPWLNELRRQFSGVDGAANPRTHGAANTQPNVAVAQPKAGGEWIAPRSPTEQALARLWQDALRGGPVGALDNFFESGGHSLLAMQLARRIREGFAVEISLQDVFKRPQLRDLAEYIDQLIETAAAQDEAGLGRPEQGFEYGEL